MKFNSLYGTHNEVQTEPGKEFKLEYERVVDESGKETLRCCGETNIQDDIQSHAESVDINVILARYQMGDTDAIERIKGFYADVSGLPVSLSEMLNINLRGQDVFAGLPADLRAIWNNDYMQFLADPSKISQVNEAAVDNAVETVEVDVKSDKDVKDE